VIIPVPNTYPAESQFLALWGMAALTSRNDASIAADKCEDVINVIECVTNVQLLNVIVIVMLAFVFMNRWHDAASSIATIVSTRVLRHYGQSRPESPILIIEIIAVQAPCFSRRGRSMLVKVVDQRDVPAGLVQLWVEEPTSIR